jgi:GGDEF domain-containing protein
MAYPGGKSIIGDGVDRVLTREVFLHFLDLEVKRSRRYQNFFSVLVLQLDELPNHDNGTAIQDCCRRLTRLLAEEMRDSDILGALGEKRLAVILPYADLMAGGNTRSRFESSLQFCDFSRDGFRVVIEQVCFPRDGTETSDLVRKVAGSETLHQRQEPI